MKAKVFLGSLLLGSFLVAGFCQASQSFGELPDLRDESSIKTGLPVTTQSPVLLERKKSLIPLGLKKRTKKTKRGKWKISPRSDELLEIEDVAIKKAKAHDSLKKKNRKS